MNDVERAICARIAEIIEKARFSQREFAARFSMSRNQVAAIVYGQTPVKYEFARAFCASFDIDPIWLATGYGPVFGEMDLPACESFGIRKNALFSSVYSKHIAPQLGSGQDTVTADVCIRMVNALAISRTIDEKFMQVDGGEVDNLRDEIENAVLPVLEKFPNDPGPKILRRVASRRRIDRTVNGPWKALNIKGTLPESLDLDLTRKPITPKHEFVNQWHSLKARIQKATEKPGGRSMLADFLDVDLTQISRWLSNRKSKSKSAPEPGADYALKMLQWVEAQERQK